jgi:hypothetical protein
MHSKYCLRRTVLLVLGDSYPPPVDEAVSLMTVFASFSVSPIPSGRSIASLARDSESHPMLWIELETVHGGAALCCFYLFGTLLNVGLKNGDHAALMHDVDHSRL